MEHRAPVRILRATPMRVPQITRNLIAGAALLATAAAANAASAAEKPVGTYGELRTVLAFKVPDAAVQTLLPQGWQASPATAGPSKDANLNVIFIDVLTVQNPDGSAGETYRAAVLAVPAKKKGTDMTVGMVVGGLSTPPNVPGAYGNFALANATVDRHSHTDSAGKTNVEESWEFKSDSGDAIQMELQFVRGVAARSKIETTPYSGAKPDFHRIYRIEQAADVLRSAATGVDRAQKYTFKATGAKLSPVFNGSEQLISITSLPFYTRQVSLPEEVTE
jgi:hypothetical protein